MGALIQKIYERKESKKMNLKEAFRYQRHLMQLMMGATNSVCSLDHALKITKTHLRKKHNPEAEDLVEEVEVEPFTPNDDVIAFMDAIIEERLRLGTAISEAKRNLSFDLDSAISTNKARREQVFAIKSMLRWQPTKGKERGTDYKFNAEGNQQPYYYDIEVSKEYAYDVESARTRLKELSTKADEVSAQIDLALVGTDIGFTPIFDVNSDFNDTVEAFINR